MNTKSLKARLLPFSQALANHNFRFLWLGESISLIGDQFYVVALPWLVFELTGSILALATVLLVEGIPRLLFMLVGGVFTDRFSVRNVMLGLNILKFLVTVCLTGLVVTHTVQLWMLYLIAFLFGLIDAFYQPAFLAAVPLMMNENDVQAGNALVQSSIQLALSIGPGLAGVLVAAVGAASALGIDAFTFAFTSLCLFQVHHAFKAPEISAQDRQNVLADIREMLTYVWRDTTLKPFVLITIALNIFVTGPLIIGPAALAKDRFAEGAVVLGLLLSAIGVGSLLGTLSAGTLNPQKFGATILGFIAVAGLCLGLVGITFSLPLAFVWMMVVGGSMGFSNVLMITWLQKQVEPAMLGRFMSLIGLISFGIVPISSGLAGILASVNLMLLFAVASAGLILTCLLAGLNPQIRSLQVAS